MSKKKPSGWTQIRHQLNDCSKPELIALIKDFRPKTLYSQYRRPYVFTDVKCFCVTAFNSAVICSSGTVNRICLPRLSATV